MAGLWRQADARGLVRSTQLPVEDWIFHMSLAYCSSLSPTAWRELTAFIEPIRMPPATCVVSEADVVAFDNGHEY